MHFWCLGVFFRNFRIFSLCRADLGWIFYFGPANFRKIAGEFLSEFWWRISIANFSALFFQGFRPPKEFTPKIHVQNCRHSSPISFSWTQNLFTAIFCLRGRPTFSGGPKFPAGGHFFDICREILGLAITSLCSRVGRSPLKTLNSLKEIRAGLLN